ncbi:MAG: DNA-directed RNA polymerase [Candidatus Marsarchaeota archaeon]|jgi:DNA-directed RNA polymerase (rpoE), archaeal and eukaryotic form|nr:DNA-directed RNA polymerase [Candidatus Marsarchaeota archaeon]
MYYIYTVRDTFKMPPDKFGGDIVEVASEMLQKKYEGSIDKDMGVIVCVFNVRDIGDGNIYPGDPSTHHDAEFDVVTYAPHVDELVVGDVTELAEFGAFMRIGPMDGLVHVSQIANDFLSLDRKIPAFLSKKTSLSLKKGDIAYAKISTVSMKSSVKDSKIALTMRPTGLGKSEWAGIQEQSQRGGNIRRPQKKPSKK